MIRRGGRYVMVGHSTHPVTLIPNDIVRKHATIIGNASGSVRHYYRALEFMKDNCHRFSWNDLISNSYPLEQVNTAIERMHQWQEVKPALTFD
jgi:threonine dehydrogenase-like Zn-dependent dehydrogenase